MQRSLFLFQEAVKSKASYTTYKYTLDKFLQFFKIKDYDSLLRISDKKLQEMVEDYISHLKKTLSPNSVRSMYSGIELFFVINEKNLNWKKIRKFFPQVQKRSGKDAWSNLDIKRMLQVEKSKRNRAIVHMFASTGVRVGAIPDLRMRNVFDMGDGCKAVLVYADSIEEYWTFLTPEASIALDDYLEERKRDGEKINSDSPVFRKHYQIGAERKPSPISAWALKSIIPKLIKNAGIYRDKKGNRYNVQADHGFRKRFNTILKKNTKIPYAITERLMGHRQDLDAHYLSMDKEDLYSFFKLATHDLTLSDEERQKVKIKRLEDEQKNIHSLEKKVEMMEQYIRQKGFKNTLEEQIKAIFTAMYGKEMKFKF